MTTKATKQTSTTSRITNADKYYHLQKMMEHSDTVIFKKAEIDAYFQSVGLSSPQWIFNTCDRVARGVYDLSTYQKNLDGVSTASEAEVVEFNMVSNQQNEKKEDVKSKEHTEFIPDRLKEFVRFGVFSKLNRIIKTREFFPIFITGPTGNGKTETILQTCALNKRECFRVNVSIGTVKDDLMGGFRLINGNTVYQDGPVVTAMRRGGILLLDELDKANPNRIMSLIPILDGYGYYNEHTGEHIKPAPGFNIVATSNTNGQGNDESGLYITSQILDEAFLDRLHLTFEHPYPSQSIEYRILNKYAKSIGLLDGADDDVEYTKAWLDILTKWTENIRTTAQKASLIHVISTRKLISIVRTYKIFDNMNSAVDLNLQRFDEAHKTAFKTIYEAFLPELKMTNKIKTVSIGDPDDTPF